MIKSNYSFILFKLKDPGKQCFFAEGHVLLKYSKSRICVQYYKNNECIQLLVITK